MAYDPVSDEPRPPLPPFTRETAIQKVRAGEDAWAFDGDRIAVRFAYEFHDESGQWHRAYGNENWAFDEHGLMRRRYACINDHPIADADRKYRWPQGTRPGDHPGLSDLGL